MRLAVVALFGWYIALSLTPTQTVPTGLGISIAHQRGEAVAADVLEALRPSVWMNWTMNDQCMATPECLPMAYTLRPEYQDAYLATANDSPGRLILLGSEPNLPETYTSPEVAAESVRRWRLEYDGPIACCGTVQWDGYGWESWLNRYLEVGGETPDYFHIHIFDRFAYPPVKAFQAWMEAHDVVRPVIVSEAAAPWDSAEHNAEYMTRLAQFVADGELYAVIWYSAPADWHGIWPTTDLMDWDATALTPLGLHWLSLQLGGANDPTATPTPVCGSCVPDEEQPTQPQRTWLPWGER